MLFIQNDLQCIQALHLLSVCNSVIALKIFNAGVGLGLLSNFASATGTSQTSVEEVLVMRNISERQSDEMFQASQ